MEVENELFSLVTSYSLKNGEDKVLWKPRNSSYTTKKGYINIEGHMEGMDAF